MDNNKIKNIVEVLLFVSGKPLSVDKLMSIIEVEDKKVLEEAILALQQEYRDLKKGIQIVEIAKGYYMCSLPEYSNYVNKLLKKNKKIKLSKQALEVLAIIAYKQREGPVSKKIIDHMRKINSDYIIKNLLEYKLIKEVGREKEGLKEYSLYEVSDHFFRLFGLKDLNDFVQLVEAQSLNKTK